MDLSKIIKRFTDKELEAEYFSGFVNGFKEYKSTPTDVWVREPVVKKEIDRGHEWAKKTLTRWKNGKK